MSRLKPQFFDAKGLSLEELEHVGTDLAEMHRAINWLLGDVARYAEARWPNTWEQVFPEWISPGLVARCKAVAAAYPNETDRNPLATWSIHMREANAPDRIQRVQAHVDAGRNSDEARKATQADSAEATRPRWLLAVDVHYFLHRFWYSGAGVEAAVQVAEWVQRTVDRLKEKGLTDMVCCFDSRTNFRKELTKDWEDKYKGKRGPKDPELVQQLQLVRELLEGHGFYCMSEEGYESDDCMASCAAQFPGRITLFSQDKDMRQCLSDHCNVLLDVEWTEDETSGDMLPDYKWLSAKQHTETTEIRPDQWAEYQAIMGDTVDGVRGAPGIGAKGAADLMREFGTIEAVIQAARDESDSIKPKKREAIIEFEAKSAVTRQLVTLRTDLQLPSHTRI